MPNSAWPCALGWDGSPREAFWELGLGRGCRVPPGSGAGETLFPLRGTVRAAAGAGNHATAAGVCVP